jgi:hypothetical protein
MTLTNTLADAGKIFVQFIWDLLYFPLWWYSRGLWGVIQWVGHFLNRKLASTGVLVWLKNLFTPMFGQRDIAGKLISFVVRCVQIVVRSIVMCFWIAFALAALAAWLIAPIFILYQLAFQLGFFDTQL